MKIVFVIFVLPHELCELEKRLIALNQASKYVDGANYEFVISLGLSDYLVDWDASLVKRDFFITKFNNLKKLTEWANDATFQIREDILGVVQARRLAHLEKQDATHFIWLDTDIVFDERSLAYIENAISGIEKQKIEKYIITPEIVRYWDITWDCLVNEKYLDKELNFCRMCDPYIESGIKGDVSVEVVENTIYNQPKFKFGGGWFVVLSKPVLDRIPIPESIGAYGLDDTFLMWGMDKLNSRGDSFYQFKLKNLVVCEDFIYRNFDEYDTLITRINRRDEFLAIAHKAFPNELNNL